MFLHHLKENVYLFLFETVEIQFSDLKYLRSRGPEALSKRCSENIQQIYRGTPMPKCDFIKVASSFIEITLWRKCSTVNLLHILRTAFSKNSTGWLLPIFVTLDSWDNGEHTYFYKQLAPKMRFAEQLLDLNHLAISKKIKLQTKENFIFFKH